MFLKNITLDFVLINVTSKSAPFSGLFWSPIYLMQKASAGEAEACLFSSY